MSTKNNPNRVVVPGMVLNNFLQIVQIVQNKNLRKEVIEITKAIERQTALQSQSHTASMEVMERQLHLLEAEQIRKQVERATKQVIFSIRQTIKKIENAGSNLGKYLRAKESYEFLSNSDFTVESVESIEDKEIFQDCIEKLSKLASESLAILSDEELKVINDCTENTENIKLLDTVEIEYTNLKTEYEVLDKENEKSKINLEKKGSSNTLVANVGVLLFLWGLGYGLYCLISSSADKDGIYYAIGEVVVGCILMMSSVAFLNKAGVFLFLGSFGYGVYCLISNSAAKDGIYYAIGGVVVGLSLGSSGSKADKKTAVEDIKVSDPKLVEFEKKLNACELRVREIIGDGYGTHFLDSVKSTKLKLIENSRNLLTPHLISE